MPTPSRACCSYVFCPIPPAIGPFGEVGTDGRGDSPIRVQTRHSDAIDRGHLDHISSKTVVVSSSVSALGPSSTTDNPVPCVAEFSKPDGDAVTRKGEIKGAQTPPDAPVSPPSVTDGTNDVSTALLSAPKKRIKAYETQTINMEDAKRIAAALVERSEDRMKEDGAGVHSLTFDIREKLGMSICEDAHADAEALTDLRVTRVVPGGQADRLGLRIGWALVSMDGISLDETSANDVRAAIVRKKTSGESLLCLAFEEPQEIEATIIPLEGLRGLRRIHKKIDRSGVRIDTATAIQASPEEERRRGIDIHHHTIHNPILNPIHDHAHGAAESRGPPTHTRHRRNQSSLSLRDLPVLGAVLEKRTSWGVWQRRHVRVREFALFYAKKLNTIQDKKLVKKVGKALRAAAADPVEAASRSKLGDLTMVPFSAIETVTVTDGCLVIHCQGRRQLTFRASAARPVDLGSWVDGLQIHLRFYRKVMAKEMAKEVVKEMTIERMNQGVAVLSRQSQTGNVVEGKQDKTKR